MSWLFFWGMPFVPQVVLYAISFARALQKDAATITHAV